MEDPFMKKVISIVALSLAFLSFSPTKSMRLESGIKQAMRELKQAMLEEPETIDTALSRLMEKGLQLRLVLINAQEWPEVKKLLLIEAFKKIKPTLQKADKLILEAEDMLRPE